MEQDWDDTAAFPVRRGAACWLRLLSRFPVLCCPPVLWGTQLWERCVGMPAWSHLQRQDDPHQDPGLFGPGVKAASRPCLARGKRFFFLKD